jgi:CheY-like chemotaxis protein
VRAEVAAEFGGFLPRAIVLDDHNGSRRATALSLQERGFEVFECETVDEFNRYWSPGMVDLIVADWQLSDHEHGDEVLADVRLRDWDVPLVLVSGKLDEDEFRVKVLEVLLGLGGSKFVARGADGIEKACDEGEALIERRDMTLLKVVLALRQGAREDAVIQSSNGPVTVKSELARLVAAPSAMHKSLNELTSIRSRRLLGERQ